MSVAVARRLADGLLPPIVGSAVEEAGGFETVNPATTCPRCGEALGPGCRGPEDGGCPARGAPWDRLHQLGPYQDELAAWIGRMKFRREWVWAEEFGRRLAAAHHAADPEAAAPLLVAAVPMPLRRRWRRGFNQSWLMARAFAAERTRLGQPTAVRALLRRRGVATPQRGTDRRERLRRMKRAFAPARPLRPVTPGPVVLVDDVLTTGATLRASAGVLRDAGHGPIEVAVAAVVPRHR